MKKITILMLAALAVAFLSSPVSAQSDLFSFLGGRGPVKIPAANKVAQIGRAHV